jgi:hypothetical protein
MSSNQLGPVVVTSVHRTGPADVRAHGPGTVR